MMQKKNRAFLKWAGGKYSLVEHIQARLPQANKLIEPFVGAGSVFLNTQFSRYLLNDINPDLINLYNLLKAQPDALINGTVKHFGDRLLDPSGKVLKVPHMGWNQVSQTKSHPLWRDIPDDSRFYFVHSYYVEVEDLNQVVGVTNYSLDFVACLSEGNIFAVQFHPEKSQEMGQTLLRNFLTWDGNE